MSSHVVVVRFALSPELWGIAQGIARASRRTTREVVEDWAWAGVHKTAAEVGDYLKRARGA